MLKIGLTGGIASGKSLALAEFARLGVHTIDADALAHQAILPGGPAYPEIVERFGPDILAEDGTIDRHRLGRLVFTDQKARRDLNALVHPRVLAAEEEIIARLESRADPREMVMVDAALMVEVGSYRRYDRLVVVSCPPELQLERLVRRDGLTREQALSRIRVQLPLSEKIRHADFVLENAGTPAELRRQVARVHRELVLLAAERASE